MPSSIAGSSNVATTRAIAGATPCISPPRAGTRSKPSAAWRSSIKPRRRRELGDDDAPFCAPVAIEYFTTTATLYVRTHGDPSGVLRSLQSELRAIDPRVDANDVRTIQTAIAQSLFGVTMGVGLLGVIGVIALALASLGLYGALAHAVRERQREIAVRMAIGAGRGSVIRLILWQGFIVVSIGLGFGLASALLIGRALRTVLFGITPADPFAIGTAVLVLLATAACACYLPAWRASLDPLTALREG